MTVNQCSMDAYHQTTEKRATLRTIVYSTIAKHPYVSSSDICEYTKLNRTSVTGRLRELEKDGLIIKNGQKVDQHTNITVNTYTVKKGE